MFYHSFVRNGNISCSTAHNGNVSSYVLSASNTDCILRFCKDFRPKVYKHTSRSLLWSPHRRRDHLFKLPTRTPGAPLISCIIFSQSFLSNSNFTRFGDDVEPSSTHFQQQVLKTPPKIVRTEMFEQGGARMVSTSVLTIHHGVVDQLGRSLPWHLFGKRLGFQIGRGREFKSRPLHLFYYLIFINTTLEQPNIRSRIPSPEKRICNSCWH